MNLWFLFGIIPFGIFAIGCLCAAIIYMIYGETEEGFGAIITAIIITALNLLVFVGSSMNGYKTNVYKHKGLELYKLTLPSNKISGHFALGCGYINDELKWEVYTQDAQGIYHRKRIDNYGIIKDADVPTNQAWLEWDSVEYDEQVWWTLKEHKEDKHNILLHINPATVTKQIDDRDGIVIGGK